MVIIIIGIARILVVQVIRHFLIRSDSGSILVYIIALLINPSFALRGSVVRGVGGKLSCGFNDASGPATRFGARGLARA